MAEKYNVTTTVDLNELFKRLNDEDKKSFVLDFIFWGFNSPDRKNFLKELAETTLGGYGVVGLVLSLFKDLDADDKADVISQIEQVK